MADHHDSIDFQHYELLPKHQTIRRPHPDKHADINSKPLANINNKQLENNKKQQEKQAIYKQILQKNKRIQQLTSYLSQIQKELNIQNQNNKQMHEFIEHIKDIVHSSNCQNQHLIKNLQYLIQKNIQVNHVNKPQSEPSELIGKLHLSEQIIKRKQQQIRELKAQLFQSTANNINAIFNTQINEQKTLLKELSEMKNSLNKMQTNTSRPSQCKHEEKIIGLIRSYQQMLKIYHQNQKSIHELKIQTQQNFVYFSSLRAQLPYSVQQICSNITNQKIIYLQKRINEVVDNLKNIPERVKTEEQQDSRVKLLLQEIQQLNLKLRQRQMQIQKMRQANQELLRKSRAHDQCEVRLSKVKDSLDIKVKQKDMKISQLQNVIEQMDIKASRAESINSQQSDVQIQKNNIRNLKAIIVSLKQQNQILKSSIIILESENKQIKKCLNQLQQSKSQNSTTVTAAVGCQPSSIPIVSCSPHNSPCQSYLQRVNKDQGSFRIIEDIVSVLAQSVLQKNCKCLQLTTDCLLSLNQQYPELQDILQGLGLILKTNNLLPIPD